MTAVTNEGPGQGEPPGSGDEDGFTPEPWWPGFTDWLTSPSSAPGVPLWWNKDGPEIARLRRLYARGFRLE